MMSMAEANSTDKLLDPHSVIVRMVFVEAEAISLSVGARPVAGGFNTEVVTGISEIVPVAAPGVTTTGADFTRLESSIEV